MSLRSAMPPSLRSLTAKLALITASTWLVLARDASTGCDRCDCGENPSCRLSCLKRCSAVGVDPASGIAAVSSTRKTLESADSAAPSRPTSTDHGDGADSRGETPKPRCGIDQRWSTLPGVVLPTTASSSESGGLACAWGGAAVEKSGAVGVIGASGPTMASARRDRRASALGHRWVRGRD